MSRTNSSSYFPIGLTIELVRFYKDRACWLWSRKYYNIRWYAIFCMDLQDISHLYVLWLDLMLQTRPNQPIFWWIALFIPSIALIVIISLFCNSQSHHQYQRGQIREQKSYIRDKVPTLRIGTSCDRLIASWKKLKNSLNWLNNTRGMKLRKLYFWLFTAFEIVFGG
jgi:hypothetical protein